MNLTVLALLMSIALLKPIIVSAKAGKRGVGADASTAIENQEEKFHASDNDLNKIWKRLKTAFKEKPSDWKRLQAEQSKSPL